LEPSNQYPSRQWGKSISGTGITPDIEVFESSDEFRIGTETDNQLDFAVTLLNG